MSVLDLTLLGVPRLSYQGHALDVQNKHLALICYVVLQGRACTRGEITELLWGTGRGGSLRTALYKLRRLPGADTWFVDDGDFIEIRGRSDLDGLERLAAERTPSDAQLNHLATCADADTSELLFGFEPPTPSYGEWLEEQRRRANTLLDERFQSAALTLSERGQYARAKRFAEQLVARNPLNEAAHRLLMQLEYDSGHLENVHRAFERCRAALKEYLGVCKPAPETFKLHRQLMGTHGAGAEGLLLRLGDRVPGRATRLVGRQGLLAGLSAEVKERSVLLHGFGGVGKTALAAELASGWLSTGNVLWLQAGLSTATELAEAAGQAVGIQGGLLSSDTLREALRREQTALVVIDDVWDENAVTELRQRLPSLPLVVTARRRITGLKRLDIGILAREDARRLLALEAGVALTEYDTDPNLDALCETLGDHPFALRLAAAKLKHDRLSPPQLLAQLANAPHALQAPQGWRETGRESVSALLQASLDALSDDAYEAFLAVGALPSRAVTAPLLARLLRRDTETAEIALIELQARALAERTASPGSDLVRYALHDLAHSFAREKTYVRTRTVIQACRDLIRTAQKDFELLGAEMANLVGALGAAHEANDQHALVEMMAGLVIGEAYFYVRGHTPRSLSILEMAVRWAKETGQLSRAHHFATRLGDAYRVQHHDFARALEAYTEGARLARRTKNTAREAILISLCGVSRHHLGAGSERDFERAYQLAQGVGDGDALGQVLQHRGYVAAFRHDWALVERLNMEAVEVARTLKRDLNADQARAADLLFYAVLNLGEAKRKLGNFE